MNCPGCGRFMALLIAFEVDGTDIETSAFWWVCNNDFYCWRWEMPIPAPEYDWLWHCETIPLDALLDWPELQAEYEQMWAQLPASQKRHFVNILEKEAGKRSLPSCTRERIR